MITPQQFLESFLRDKTTAYAMARPHLASVYTEYFGEPLVQHVEQFMPRDTVRAVVEDVRQSGDTASAVTRESLGRADIRTRYRLQTAGEAWKIIGIDRACFLCQGVGRIGTSRCEKCNGEGWYERD